MSTIRGPHRAAEAWAPTLAVCRRYCPGTSERTIHRIVQIARLGDTQLEILRELLSGELPVRELAEQIGRSIHHVGRDLRALERAGFVARRGHPGSGARRDRDLTTWKLAL